MGILGRRRRREEIRVHTVRFEVVGRRNGGVAHERLEKLAGHVLERIEVDVVRRDDFFWRGRTGKVKVGVENALISGKNVVCTGHFEARGRFKVLVIRIRQRVAIKRVSSVYA